MYRLHERIILWQRLDAFFKDVLSTFAAQVLIVGFTLLTLIFIGRRLGSASKGIFELSILLPGMLSLLLSGGINMANTYFAGTEQSDLATLTAHSVSFTVISTLIGVIVVAASALSGLLTALMGDIPLFILLLGLFLLPPRLLGNAFQGILQGKQDIFKINVIRLSRALVFFVLTIIVLFGLDGDTTGLILVYLLSELFQVVSFAYILYREGASFRPQWQMTTVRKALRFGLRGQIGNILQFYNYRLDAFILNVFLGPSSVGVYNVSVQFGELLWFLPNAIGFVIFPKAAASSRIAMNRFTPRIFLATLAVSAVGAVGLALVGHPLIILLFGQDFSAAYYPLLALLPGIVLLGSAKVLTNEITGRGYPQYNSVNAGIALVVTILLDLALIPRMGLMGAAIASSCSYTLTWFISMVLHLLTRRHTDTP